MLPFRHLEPRSSYLQTIEWICFAHLNGDSCKQLLYGTKPESFEFSETTRWRMGILSQRLCGRVAVISWTTTVFLLNFCEPMLNEGHIWQVVNARKEAGAGFPLEISFGSAILHPISAENQRIAPDYTGLTLIMSYNFNEWYLRSRCRFLEKLFLSIHPYSSATKYI